VALLADWASDTPESHKVARLCGERDYSIHLGDSYYVGNEKEIADNFNSTFGAPWPYGKMGSFALLGNHEMYSSGKTYFSHLLPYMHLYDCGDGAQQQEASFFCLENKYWRIIGLDTGYYSLKGFLGLASNNKLKLHEMQVQWIKNVVQPEKDNRGLIFLSHHQPLSAFEDEYINPAKQLSELLGANRTVLWFWGHEHRLSVYGENVFDNGLKVYGSCIGNGGMPVDIDKTPKEGNTRNLVLYDSRERKKIDGKYPVGYNGYTILKLNGPEAAVEYYDDNGDMQQERKILEERWTVGDGKLSGTSVTDFTSNQSKKIIHMQEGIEKAIDKEPAIMPKVIA
jgi:hypothetical protein